MVEPADVPLRRRDVTSADVAGNKLLYADGDDQAFTLNVSAWAIFELCDGERDVGAISKLLADDLGCPSYEIVDDVLNALAELQRTNLIELRS